MDTVPVTRVELRGGPDRPVDEYDLSLGYNRRSFLYVINRRV